MALTQSVQGIGARYPFASISSRLRWACSVFDSFSAAPPAAAAATGGMALAVDGPLSGAGSASGDGVGSATWDGAGEDGAGEDGAGSASGDATGVEASACWLAIAASSPIAAFAKASRPAQRGSPLQRPDPFSAAASCSSRRASPSSREAGRAVRTLLILGPIGLNKTLVFRSRNGPFILCDEVTNGSWDNKVIRVVLGLSTERVIGLKKMGLPGEDSDVSDDDSSSLRFFGPLSSAAVVLLSAAVVLSSAAGAFWLEALLDSP